jgi:UDP-N-acetylmuramoyl-tripeptide--D-alanyl-D-alanine ligase
MPASVDIGLDRVLAATGGAVVRRAAERFAAAVIDGRNVPAGALFFAVKGDRFDGHDFAGQAVKSGATGVVVARGRGAALAGADSATVIEVDDVIAALGQLGRAHREAMTALKVVAITGSNGKTTTKEMVAAILVAKAGADAVLKTEGNLNNHLGVPLTLLRLTAAHRYAVVEMGMSALGEIAYLTGLAQPDVAMVVNVAPVHLESLGTLENVAQAKGEIWQGLKPNGFAVLPADEPRLSPHAAPVPEDRRLTFGPRAPGLAVGYEDVQSDASGLTVRLHLRGVTSRAWSRASRSSARTTRPTRRRRRRRRWRSRSARARSSRG